MVEAHPYREDIRALLMRALYRDGRQADAIEVYQAGARLLADELGLDPGPALRDMYQRILVSDPGLVLTEPGQGGATTGHGAPGTQGAPSCVLLSCLRTVMTSSDGNRSWHGLTRSSTWRARPRAR
nr:hypothetical protein GCM10025730_22160 [Promicromonospora thailandica]